MDQLKRSHKHRAEVVEIYNDGRMAAVRFNTPSRKGRVECVSTGLGMSGKFEVGMRGTVSFTQTLNGHVWIFLPNKKQKKAE